MEQEIITYNWILIKKSDNSYLGWSKAIDEPPNGDPGNMEWVAWGKELPEDIDEAVYRYIDGELIKGE